MKVLVVEDEADIRKILRVCLTRIQGLGEIFEAGNGEEGLELARLAKPDLIVLDKSMPVMDGLAAFRELRLRRETAEIPVVFVSAHLSDPEAAYLREQGVKDIIFKPFDAFALVDRVARLLGLPQADARTAARNDKI